MLIPFFEMNKNPFDYNKTLSIETIDRNIENYLNNIFYDNIILHKKIPILKINRDFEPLMLKAFFPVTDFCTFYLWKVENELGTWKTITVPECLKDEVEKTVGIKLRWKNALGVYSLMHEGYALIGFSNQNKNEIINEMNKESYLKENPLCLTIYNRGKNKNQFSAKISICHFLMKDEIVEKIYNEVNDHIPNIDKIYSSNHNKKIVRLYINKYLERKH